MLVRTGIVSCPRRIHFNASVPIRQNRFQSTSRRASSVSLGGLSTMKRKPVLVFDIMDTIVFDPFFTEMPKFFNMSFQELLKAKHPSAWVEFECNSITEDEMLAKFFADGRPVDGSGLRSMLSTAYRYVDGMEELLQSLQAAGFEMHAMSNYPLWFTLIETKLQTSRYLPWTFVSCTGPMEGIRKPDERAYHVVSNTLGVGLSDIVFVDDRKVNVDAAIVVGVDGIHFKDAKTLAQELRIRGIEW